MSATDSGDFFIVPLEQTGKDLPASPASKEPVAELVLVTSGYVVRECDFHSVRINPKDIHLSFSRRPASISEGGGELQGWYCRFNAAFSDPVYLKENLKNQIELISSFLHQYPLRLRNKTFQRLAVNLDSLTHLFGEAEKDYSLIQAYLVTCIYEIRKEMKESSLDFYPAKAFSITKQYHDLLLAHLEQEQSPAFYARLLKITPNHLNKSVRSVTGKTAIGVLNEMRLTEAKLRLKHTDDAVCEIACQLGFEDQSYFSRFFRKATGSSPIAFRKKQS
ncbi:MAG: AraC family transcriptional regulator [Dysgonamonadaceae bacterium]|jgi:AraC-like DNA-binding protein|nr:AraC family transcriptional regulator [Dysgonamonadaceae bacterium]